MSTNATSAHCASDRPRIGGYGVLQKPSTWNASGHSLVKTAVFCLCVPIGHVGEFFLRVGAAGGKAQAFAVDLTSQESVVAAVTAAEAAPSPQRARATNQPRTFVSPFATMQSATA